MKVGDLIDLLGDFDAEAEVLFTYNYGDYWRTTVAATIESVGDGKVVHSAYHNMDKVIDEDCYDGEEDNSTSESVRRNRRTVRRVVLLG
jgi:hypothetical protein